MTFFQRLWNWFVCGPTKAEREIIHIFTMPVPQRLEDEQHVLHLSRDLWNSFLALPGGHVNDRADVSQHVRAIQAIVMARLFARANPEECSGYRSSLETKPEPQNATR